MHGRERAALDVEGFETQARSPARGREGSP